MSASILQEKKEKVAELQHTIDEFKDKEGPLMPIMHKAQEIFGYLPIEVQEYIAEALDIPMSDIYGVATFYSQFTLKPKGKYAIGVCLGTACYVRGGKKIIEKLKELLGVEPGGTTKDGKFTLEVMRCIGACGLAPAITINGKVYKQVNPDKLRNIIDKY